MTLGKSKIFLLFCLSFILGVLLGNFFNFYIMALLAMIFVIAATLWWTNRKIMLIGFLGLTLVAGCFRYVTSFPNNKENFIGKLYSQKITVEGVVVREPDQRSDRTNLTVRPKDYIGNILLTVGKYPEYQYGDFLKVTGRLEEPKESEGFSYKNYLSRYDTYGLMNRPGIEKLKISQGNLVKAALLKVKAKFTTSLQKLLPEPHNALVGGLILGLKRSLPDDLKNAFIIVGISHIVVISGYNISVITRFVSKGKAWLGRRAIFWLSLGVVLAFVVMTGGEASVVRAAVMGLLVVLALNVGRVYNPVNALVFVGTVMVAQNPKILSFDVGFQLSFASMVGLIYLAPMFEKWLQFLPDTLGFRTNLASTLSALSATTPLLIYYFDRISIVAPLVNVLVLWIVPYAMFFGFFTGLVSMVFLPAAKLLVGVLWTLLQYIITISEFFSRLPFAAKSARINLYGVAVYYLFLFAAVWIYRHKKEFYYYLEYAKAKI
ncbi:ComEC family competence protein [bacterium]|nr:MAG: ComEC family competence protein [bacterium]